MKRRAATIAKGKGRHSPDHIQQKRRPTGHVKPVISRYKFNRMIHDSEHGDAQSFKRLVIRLAVLLFILTIWGVRCAFTQTHFKFDVAHTEFPDGTAGNGPAVVWAHADSLEILFPNIPPGVLSCNPIWFAGINWVWTDDGSKYYNSAARGLSFKWSPGQGVRDQYLIIKSPSLSATFYRRRRGKTDRL